MKVKFWSVKLRLLEFGSCLTLTPRVSQSVSDSVSVRCPPSSLPSPSQRRPQLGLKIDFDFQSERPTYRAEWRNITNVLGVGFGSNRATAVKDKVGEGTEDTDRPNVCVKQNTNSETAPSALKPIKMPGLLSGHIGAALTYARSQFRHF